MSPRFWTGCFVRQSGGNVLGRGQVVVRTIIPDSGASRGPVQTPPCQWRTHCCANGRPLTWHGRPGDLLLPFPSPSCAVYPKTRNVHLSGVFFILTFDSPSVFAAYKLIIHYLLLPKDRASFYGSSHQLGGKGIFFPWGDSGFRWVVRKQYNTPPPGTKEAPKNGIFKKNQEKMGMFYRLLKGFAVFVTCQTRPFFPHFSAYRPFFDVLVPSTLKKKRSKNKHFWTF